MTGIAVTGSKKGASSSGRQDSIPESYDIRHYIAVMVREKGITVEEANFLFLRGSANDVMADCQKERFVARIIMSGISLEERKIYFSQLLGVSPTTVVDLIDRARRENVHERNAIRKSIEDAIRGTVRKP